MSTETITATKVPPLAADAITKEIAGTDGAYDTAAEATSSLMALGWPAAVAVAIVANATTANLMALGVPALAATAIYTDVSA